MQKDNYLPFFKVVLGGAATALRVDGVTCPRSCKTSVSSCAGLNGQLILSELLNLGIYSGFRIDIGASAIYITVIVRFSCVLGMTPQLCRNSLSSVSSFSRTAGLG